jgi:hypothetical protein
LFLVSPSLSSSLVLSPQLSSVKALTLCWRRLKSWTPRELEQPDGMVNWAAMICDLTLASFNSFSDRLALRVRSGGDRGRESKREEEGERGMQEERERREKE